MIAYKNISYSAKTFYGVKFKPGEIRQVPGYINNSSMIRILNYVAPKPVIDEPRRKKKSNEPEKDSIAETETKIEIPKEETTDGN